MGRPVMTFAITRSQRMSSAVVILALVTAAGCTTDERQEAFAEGANSISKEPGSCAAVRIKPIPDTQPGGRNALFIKGTHRNDECPDKRLAIIELRGWISAVATS